MQFNTKENWSKVEEYIKDQNRKPEHERKPYYRFCFMGRKTNRKAFCSYIPLTILTEILADEHVPFTTQGGRVLDETDTHYALEERFDRTTLQTIVKMKDIAESYGLAEAHVWWHRFNEIR